MNFEFAYAVDIGLNLRYELIASTCGALSFMADEATDGDRLAWGVCVHGTVVGVGFHSECHRDRFVEIYTATVQSSRTKTDGAHRPTPARRRSRRAAGR